MRMILLLMLLCGAALPCRAQFSLSQLTEATGLQKAASDGVKGIHEKVLSSLHKKYEKLDSSLEKQSLKMLARLQRKEDRLRRKATAMDSGKAVQLFEGVDDKYASLKQTLLQRADSLKAFPLKEYIPGIDSVQTALSFLKGQGVALPAQQREAAAKAAAELKGLQDQLQKANDIEAFVRQRERQLKEQLAGSGLLRQLKSINKEAFYYSQRLREYKEMLKSPEKMKQKLLGAVRGSKAFQSFMKKHSYLAKLFPTPDNYGTTAALAGLQTRSGVQGMLRQRFGGGQMTDDRGQMTAGGGGGMPGYVQQQISGAQAQLGGLKDKMSRLGIGGESGDMTMPDFRPNNQHTKSFWKRLEYGMNVQSEGGRRVIPATSEIAFTTGYRLSDKSVVGAGLSYRVGWGHEGLRHIRVTNEGVGLRSYIDIKAKGSFWLSGGCEMNYQQSFAKYKDLYDLRMWQRSGLVGLTKKYKVGKRENNMQVLWDFLSYNQVPRTQAIKVRVGFGL